MTEEKTNPLEDHPIPNNLEEAMDFLDETVGDNPEELKAVDTKELVAQCHHFLGRHLRNEWGVVV